MSRASRPYCAERGRLPFSVVLRCTTIFSNFRCCANFPPCSWGSFFAPPGQAAREVRRLFRYRVWVKTKWRVSRRRLFNTLMAAVSYRFPAWLRSFVTGWLPYRFRRRPARELFRFSNSNMNSNEIARKSLWTRSTVIDFPHSPNSERNLLFPAIRSSLIFGMIDVGGENVSTRKPAVEHQIKCLSVKGIPY